MTGNPDITYTQGWATILSIWEANVSIWCNNLIRLKPFIRTMPRLYALMTSPSSDSHKKSNPTRLRHWEDDRVVSGNHELSTIRKGAMPLGSDPDLTADDTLPRGNKSRTQYMTTSLTSRKGGRRGSVDSDTSIIQEISP